MLKIWSWPSILYLNLMEVGANPSFFANNSNLITKLFEWVKNVGRRVEKIGKGALAKVYKVMWFGIPVAKKTFDGPNVDTLL